MRRTYRYAVEIIEKEANFLLEKAVERKEFFEETRMDVHRDMRNYYMNQLLALYDVLKEMGEISEEEKEKRIKKAFDMAF